MIRKLFRTAYAFLKYVAYLLVRSLAGLVPKKNGLWVFGAWEGNGFSDNGKYLFMHMLANQKTVDMVWLTKNKSVVSEVEAIGGKACLTKKIYSKWILARAQVILVTHSCLSDLDPWFISGSIIVQLYHASFPLKKMGFDDFSFYPQSKVKRVISAVLNPSVYTKPHLSIASSDATQEILSHILGIPRSSVLITGYPRVDAVSSVINTALDDQKINSMLGKFKDERIIYFAPTFRKNKNFNFFDFDFNYEELIHVLEKSNAILIFRFHPFDKDKLKTVLKAKHPRIIIEDSELADPYPLLKKVDILITDFSSIYADFLVLNRPIIFATFDYDDYIQSERPLYHSFNEITPGPKVYSWPQLIDAIHLIAVDRIDSYGGSRAEVSRMIFEERTAGMNSFNTFKAISTFARKSR